MRIQADRREVLLPLAAAIVAPAALTGLLVAANRGNSRDYVFPYLGIVRLGRVTAVIHRAHSTDVLGEGRRWLHHRRYRYAPDDMEPLVHPERPALVWGAGQDAGSRRIAGVERQ